MNIIGHLEETQNKNNSFFIFAVRFLNQNFPLPNTFTWAVIFRLKCTKFADILIQYYLRSKIRFLDYSESIFKTCCQRDLSWFKRYNYWEEIHCIWHTLIEKCKILLNFKVLTEIYSDCHAIDIYYCDAALKMKSTICIYRNSSRKCRGLVKSFSNQKLHWEKEVKSVQSTSK